MQTHLRMSTSKVWRSVTPLNALNPFRLRLNSQQKCVLLQQQQQHSPRALASSHQQGSSVRALRVVSSHADPLAASIVGAEAGFDEVPTRPPFSKQQLLDVAATFVKLWFAGIAKGPQAVEQELANILAPDVVVKADRVKRFRDTQGLIEVLAELERAHLEYHRSEHRPMLYAASPEAQRAYALVEGTYQDVGALPGHPATFRISKVHHILSMEVQNGRIGMLWLHRQLTEEDKDELLHEPLSCFPTPFPRDSLLLADAAQHAAQSAKMVDAVQGWWQAWAAGPNHNGNGSSTSINSSAASSTSNSAASNSTTSSMSSSSTSSRRSRSRNDKAAAAAQLLAPDFRMLDAYGLWPAMKAQGRRFLSRDAALRYMQSLSYHYDIDLSVLDVAVAEGSLACFSHWQAKLKPRWQGQYSSMGPSLESVEAAADVAPAASSSSSASGPSQQQQQQQQQASSGEQSEQQDGSMLVDGMAVDLFNEDTQLKVIWVFRGPVMPQERHLFLEYDKQLAAAEAELAASEQEAIRQERRLQREQQLSELLAWMNNYQQQWSSYVTHVQKQIARQQRLAKQQLIRQLQESQSLEASIEEEELQQQYSEFGQQLQQQLTQAQQQLKSLQQQAQQQIQSFQQPDQDIDTKQ